VGNTFKQNFFCNHVLPFCFYVYFFSHARVWLQRGYRFLISNLGDSKNRILEPLMRAICCFCFALLNIKQTIEVPFSSFCVKDGLMLAVRTLKKQLQEDCTGRKNV
jgi:hypothetical protein